METMSAADITPQTLFNAYNHNLKMTPGALGTVTRNLCDNASITVQKLIAALATNAVRLEADSLAGLTDGMGPTTRLTRTHDCRSD